ncbi:MAG: hypothetical protein PHF51_04875 [Candidatus ainarchaeum sp.]|nr:hypothetical protein [Candidatus ainarchaeum sp.]
MNSREAVLRVKNARLLAVMKVETRKWYASSLAKETGMSCVYASRMLQVFASEGLVELRREGKTRRAVLTENGLKVASALDEILSRLPRQEERKQA